MLLILNNGKIVRHVQVLDMDGVQFDVCVVVLQIKIAEVTIRTMQKLQMKLPRRKKKNVGV